MRLRSISRPALVLLTTAALLTGCGGTPQPGTDTAHGGSGEQKKAVTFNVRGKPVVNAGETLTAMEAAWREYKDEFDEANEIGPSTRCYFAATPTGTLHTQDGSREAAPVVCGPLGPKKKWEAMALGEEVDQGDSIMLTRKDSWTTHDPNAPDGFTLQRPDGGVPAANSNAPGSPGSAQG